MKHKYLRNVVTLELDTKKCRGCGMCTRVCPHQVLSVEAGKAKIVKRNFCMECGACARNCPFSAVSVNPGVGCAAAIIRGLLTGSAPSCGCSGESSCSDSDSSCC